MSIILLLAMNYKQAQNIMRVFIHLQLIMVIISIFLNYYYYYKWNRGNIDIVATIN